MTSSTQATEQSVVEDLLARFGAEHLTIQFARDGIPIVWVRPDLARAVLTFLKREIPQPFRLLFDLTWSPAPSRIVFSWKATRTR